MKKYLVITGGAGFVGSNLIEYLVLKTNYNIISIDNYFSGNKNNHIKNKKVKYFNGETKDVNKILKKYKSKIDTIFHFGEFSRIYQSFVHMDKCIESNTIGSHAIFNFCLINKVRLIYSATSASLGNKGYDKNLSPYAFTKSKNIEFLENLKKKPLPVVKPGSQSRRFTHIEDTVKICFKAWKENKNRYYSITNKKSYSIFKTAKLFGSKISLLPRRKGERYASALSTIGLSRKIYKNFGKISLKNYVTNFVKNND